MQVLGISFDTIEENAAFVSKFEFPFPLLSDTDRAVGMAYGAADAPDAGYAHRVSFLIDESGAIAKVYDTVKPDAHPAEVLRDIDGLG